MFFNKSYCLFCNGIKFGVLTPINLKNCYFPQQNKDKY